MISIDLRGAAVRQFVRYLCVGVINTLVTLVVIMICKSLLDVNPWVSNALGYIAGLINSFIWNKAWVFHSNRNGRAEAVKFAVGFLICYGIQFMATWFLAEVMELKQFVWDFGILQLSGYGLATLIGMGVYTVCNFVFNRLVTFK